VVEVEAVAETGLSVVVADMGAPDDMRTPDATPVIAACARYAEEVGRPVSAVVAVETGGLNAVVPFLVALKRGVPVVDGDGAGRAVPSLTMLTFSGAGVSTMPAVLADGTGQAVSLWTAGAAKTETLARPILAADFGQAAGLAIWGMDKATLRRAMPIRGSLDLARRVGVALRRQADPVAAALDVLAAAGREAEVIAHGILEPPEETTSGGFDFGRVTLRDGARRVIVYNQNENLIAWASDRAAPLATAPDSICYVTPAGQAFSNADITSDLIGREVLLVRIKACEALWSFAGIRAAFSSALTALGYPGPLLDQPPGAAGSAAD
jgi:DUF917 family protein